MAKMPKRVDIAMLDDSIEAIAQYVQGEGVKSLLTALESFKKEPQNEVFFEQFVERFYALGIAQGSVLNYAPYLSVLLSNELFDDS